MTCELEAIFEMTENPVHTSATLCLCWIAASDGVVDAGEQQLIQQFSSTARSQTQVARLLGIVRNRDTDSFGLACQVLRNTLERDAQLALLTIVIELVVIDGRLALSENHLCRFFADLFRVSSDELKSLYASITGSDMPEPGDPSSIRWWKDRMQQRANTQDSKTDDHGANTSSANGPMSKAEAYVVLGLTPDGSTEDAKNAYRRAAQAHHPDRFEQLGPEAQRAAHEMFLRIKQAYEVLK